MYENSEFYVEDAWQDYAMAKHYGCPPEYTDLLEAEYLRRFKMISSVTYVTMDELSEMTVPQLPRIKK